MLLFPIFFSIDTPNKRVYHLGQQMETETPTPPHVVLQRFFAEDDRTQWSHVHWDAEDIEGGSLLPWLELELPWHVPHTQMLEEAKSVRHLMVNHRDEDHEPGYGHRGWKSICLHGLSARQTYCHTDYGYERIPGAPNVPYRWTEIAELCPVTTAFLKGFGFTRFQRVRYMLLEAGGYILPHRDGDGPYLWAVNLALNQPDRCQFHMRGFGDLPFAPGKALKLDISNTHAVWNRSNEDRYHMIIHGSHDSSIWYDLMKRSRDKMRAQL